MTNALAEALVSDEIADFRVGEYRLYLTGGLSWGDAPTDAFEGLNAVFHLPKAVLDALHIRTDVTG